MKVKNLASNVQLATRYYVDVWNIKLIKKHL